MKPISVKSKTVGKTVLYSVWVTQTELGYTSVQFHFTEVQSIRHFALLAGGPESDP